MSKLVWNAGIGKEMYDHKWGDTLTPEEQAFNDAVMKGVLDEMEAAKAKKIEPKKPLGRPLKGANPKHNVTTSISNEDKETLKLFGKGVLAVGIERAAAMVRKFDLYNREDC